MPYYGDSTPYYYGGAFATHSSLMTGVPRSLHNPLSGRFAPHLSTITESSLSNLRRYSPVSTTNTRIRRVIDTADIDVSTPRKLSSRDEDCLRGGNRLRRDRPTIKIRSQALKDNPALQRHNEKHEKSVGELLVEKFLIKENKRLEDEECRTRVYHQVSLDRENENKQEPHSIQRRITRRMTRRRSSADIQLDPEQLQREVAYAQVQAKVLDSLLAEEQAEIEDEVRRGTLIRKGVVKGPRQILSYYDDDADGEFIGTKNDEERKKTSKAEKVFKKTKKKKKGTEKSSPSDVSDEKDSSKEEVNEFEGKRTMDATVEDGRKNDDCEDNESNSTSKTAYKIEASNSVGDFSTIWINATSANTKAERAVEQYRESIRIPVPRKALAGVKRARAVATVPENDISREESENETEIVLPVRKPYVKDTSRNSVYLTLKKHEKGNEKVKVKDEIPSIRKPVNDVDVLTKKDLLKLRVKDTLQKVLEIGTEKKETKIDQMTKPIGVNDDIELSKVKDDFADKKENDESKNNVETIKTKDADVLDTLGTQESIGVTDKDSTAIKKKINNTKYKSTMDDKIEPKLVRKKLDTRKALKTTEEEREDKTIDAQDASGTQKSVEEIDKDSTTIKKKTNNIKSKSALNETTEPKSVLAKLDTRKVLKTTEEEREDKTIDAQDASGTQKLVEEIDKDSTTIKKKTNNIKSKSALNETTEPKSVLAKLDTRKALKTTEEERGDKTIDAQDASGTQKSVEEIDKDSTTIKKKTNNIKSKSALNETTEPKSVLAKLDTRKVLKTNDEEERGSNKVVVSNDRTTKIDKESLKDKSDMPSEIKEISVANDTGENSAALSSVVTPSASCLPKASKINTDENNAVEAPELSLRAAAYLANPPKIVNFEDADTSSAESKSSKLKGSPKRFPRVRKADETFLSNAIGSLGKEKSKDSDINVTRINDSTRDNRSDLEEIITGDTRQSENMNVVSKSMMAAGGYRKEVDGTAMPTVLPRKMPTNSAYSKKSNAAFQKSALSIGPSLLDEECVKTVPVPTEVTNATIDERKLNEGVTRSESTESIDFWSEIKSSVESKNNRSIDDTKTDLGSSSTLSSIKEQPDKDKERENDFKYERDTIVRSPLGESKVEGVESAEKETDKTTTDNKKGKVRKKADLVITIPQLSRDVTSTVKRKNPLIKSEESTDTTPTPLTSTPSTPTQNPSELSTPTSEISLPVINIIEVATPVPTTESQPNEIDEEEESPSTPTNEWTNSPMGQITKWSNHDDLTNSDDFDNTMTPESSNDTSLVATPNDSQQGSPESSKKKRIIKKRKPSSKKATKKDEKNEEKVIGKGSTAKTRQEATNTLKLPENKTSPRSSPRNSPTQRPIDLIRMFYTTPSALLTATPRDLSKVRRAKIKRRRHQSRTPSVSSDSTGSTASTATTGSGDGSGASTFTELDDDPEHKRMASTRSNDSGFDGSPRISNCDMACHKKCEKLTGNLCGLNQKLVAEALQALKKAPSQSLENQRNTDTPDHFPSGRITPPAINLPRFKKYAVTDFNFLKVLGKGSFGKVLLAELRGTECVYAVKCLKKDVVLEDDDVECTLIERKVLTLATRHPYLCHLFCTFQTESHLFFVMEYLNGGDLMFHIQKSGRFPEARARFYAAEIWSGLNFLHKKGIVYRDLKLDNVLLDFEGHIRIADFGMCKLQIFLDRTADTFCGTPDYMAPEIIKGLKYNQSVDWWSYGVLLYEMLTGQSPFSGCDEDELFWSICNERPFIPRYLSQEATDVLVSLLEKDSGKRPPAHEIAVHPFFQSLPWDRLERRQLEPPFKPALDHTLDTKYFDTAFTAERPRLTPVPEQILSSMDQGVFRGFSYTNPNATD